MAKHYSITDTTAAHLETLAKKLESVAADYFSSFVLSEDKLVLKCMDGENALLTFTCSAVTGGVKVASVTLSGDNVTQTFALSNQSSFIVSTVSAAAKGIALKIKQTSNNAKTRPYGIFITKSEQGKTAVCIDPDALSVATTTLYHSGWCVTSESTTIDKVTLYSYNSANLPHALPYTSTAHVVCSGTEDYCPDLYITPTSPYAGVEGMIDIGGKSCLYSGVYALGDG